MSHKLGYEDAPKDHVKTWVILQRIVLWSTVFCAVVLLSLYFAFMY